MTTITLNDQLKGIEIYFDNKPQQNIIDSLKANSYRWHNAKKCWYAKQNIKTIAEAQKYTQDQEEAQEEIIPQTENAITNITPTAAQTKTQKIINTLPLWTRLQFVEGNIQSDRYKFVGSNYTGLSTKETASEVRKILKTQFQEVKFSITSDHNHIRIEIKESPYNHSTLEYSSELRPFQYRDYEAEHNKELNAIKDYCKNLLNSYNYDDSDSQSDYFNTHFYESVEVDYKYIQTEQTDEQKADILDYRNKLEEANKQAEEQKELNYQAYKIKNEQEHEDNLARQTEEAKQVEEIYNNITIADLETDKQYFIINAQMANCNKQNTLDQYQEQIKDNDFYLNNIKIQKEIHFTTEEALQYFSNMLLNDFTFLEQTGGSYTDDIRINSMVDYNNMTQEEQETVIFNLYGVAIYYNNQLQFVVDTQGFSYARYVGLIEGLTVTKQDNVKQFINHEELQELKQKADALEDYSVSVITDNNLLNVWHSDKWNEYKELMKTTLSTNNFKLTKAIIQQLSEDREQLKTCMYRLLKEVDGIQEQFKHEDIKQGQKVTLFYISDFGSISERRITIDSIEYTKYAQYEKAVKLIFKPQGKRKLYQSYFHSTLLVYNGWLDLPKEVLNTVEQTDNFTITKTKYLSCDKKQYDEILEHFETQGQIPIINTYKPLI